MSEEPLSLDFSLYILNLVTTALYHFGDLGDKKDIEAAKSVIDILIVLKEKTKGNLTPEEQKTLDESIHDLQIRYLQEVKFL
ncbi:MAG: DUF1844 domain-containing protein [Theionarchaea archaeon]|nr:DUF1844 domain-containing protein [Theionarchaea archaeon]MBU6999525.1 DUF1844 domain-containing protein [Theionarchaea archaeon]MBU7020311.1 DUF1844 domain-containing protein [Theionarchaea archaeon]MBU7035557.1 DUF1844 domain-containing protein [Theionarchaea archaeon]MBU7041187.1 DUF1844 domain-containing protein [Theionarchaea archaeon]